MELGGIVVERDGEAASIALSGELDVADAPALRAQVDELLGVGLLRVVVDLSAVRFLDSSMLGVLVGGARRAREAGGTLCLARPSERVARLLAITGMERLLCVEQEPAPSAAAGDEPDAEPTPA